VLQFDAMKNRILLLLFCLLSLPTITVFANDTTVQHFNKELLFITENDSYRFNKKDGYYTNGLFLKYTTPLHKKPGSALQFVEGGQQLYNAYYRLIEYVEQIDRPIAGFLYLKYGQTRFWKHQTIFQWYTSIGTIGKASQGERLQNWLHGRLNINNELSAWRWQVKNEIGFNSGATIAKNFNLLHNNINFQFEPAIQANVGNTFTNAAFAPVFKLGKFRTGKQNSWWGGHLLHQQKQQTNTAEWYLFTQPSIGYHWYNATVQGGMFRKEKGDVVTDIYPWLFRQNTGIVYNKARWSASFAVCYMGKESVTQKREQRYRSIQFAWRFN